MTGNTPNFGRDESPFGNANPLDISDDDLPFQNKLRQEKTCLFFVFLGLQKMKLGI